MSETGIFCIFIVVTFRDLETCQTRKVRQRVYRQENVTQQQARGLFADFKGMNPLCKDLMQSTWTVTNVG